ncbi:DUF4376 domain-containing protein [Billgrantia ethanolica]|uniref:DUF4376 domain-containing protein n=1 Tax=Billgrantia ethanolica TaxID=2733486 RepID=A0ABS9A5U7_9GAMM|nr:DUF4376 domain-containing protein [Halomonas ethanolica]MCE8004211.1 DUF4376 domain-containing protein [Halomonas ethanolica]
MRIWDIHPTDRTVIDPAGREAPLDPMRQQSRIPAGATSVEPPETGEHESARWAGEAWEVVSDWRGHVYWLADGSRHEITELGKEPPVDALDEEPPEPLADLAARQRIAIESARKAAEAEGIRHNDIRYAGDPENRQAIREALEAAEDAGMQAFNRWKDSDNRFHVDHPVADVWAALRAIATRRSQLINREGDFVAQIDAILGDEDLSDDEKREQLEAIEWSEA